MKYYSLGKQSPPVDFKTATLLGQAPDKGLYFPETIPVMDSDWVKGIAALTDAEIACTVIRPYVQDCLPEAAMQHIVAETINFHIPLVPVTENIFSLELFHGPTLAFKDIGARFMSRCLGYFVQGEQRKVTVLVATSGDTGGAVANGFYGVEGVEVVILYPSGKVSAVQEKQLTTAGKNITAIEVSGNFDDCQQMVKQAFTDKDIHQRRYLTSANSINVARWLPQQFYYWLAWKQWPDPSAPPVFSVPSGNFGNICAGILAWKSGLPARHFIAACNANSTVPDFLRTLHYTPGRAIATMSNAMDVSDPSNFIRVLELFNGETGALKKIFSSESISDAATRAALLRLYHQHHYLADPHGAVAFTALERALEQMPGSRGIFLETAHPVKFFDVVEPVTGEPVPLPPAIRAIMQAEKRALSMGTRYEELKDYLLATA